MPRRESAYVGHLAKHMTPHTYRPSRGGDRAQRIAPAAIADVRQALENLQPRMPGTVGALRDALRQKLGSYKAVSERLGVAPRTLERYIAAEERKGSQKRGLDLGRRSAMVEKMRSVLGPLAQSEVYKQLRAHGLRIGGLFEIRFSEENEWRKIQGKIDAATMARIVARMERGHWNKAGRDTIDAMLRGWMQIGPDASTESLPSLEDITDLSLRPAE